jgi:hypothetical protein
MKKTIEIIMPETWADITLAKYLDLLKELENYKDDEEATTAVMLYKLCGIEANLLSNISKQSYNQLRTELTKFLEPKEHELQRFITIDNVEYGFEPNLSQISYGAYADISKYDTITVDDNWAKIMSILYRPTTKHNKDLYNIETYEGKIDGSKWLEVGMDIHFGALFFFVNLSTDLQIYTLNSLMQTEETTQDYNTTSLKNGSLTQLLLNSRMETLRKLTK